MALIESSATSRAVLTSSIITTYDYVPVAGAGGRGESLERAKGQLFG